MNTRIVWASTALLLVLPVTAFAHEHRMYQVGTKQYSIVVGSLNEPVHVDDKTGVELIVSDMSVPQDPSSMVMSDGGGDDGSGGAPVMGLEKSLKVEVSAGNQKKTFDFEPQWGKDGSYQAVFYPTVQTTYSYRVFGTLNNVPIDVTYTCDPAATEDSPEDTTHVKLSDQVTQLLKGGAFSCPEARSAAEFPEQSATLADLTAQVTKLESNSGQNEMVAAALALGTLGFVFGLSALRKVSKK